MQAPKLRWQDSMDGLGVVAWTAHARTWTVTSIGRNVESVFGYSRRAWRTKGFWLSHIDVTDRELVGEFLEETLDRRRSTRETCEYRFLDANGAVRWVRTSVARRTMRASAVSGFHLDITESRTARESLSVVDEQYQFALRVAGVRIWEHDAADVDSLVPAPIAALAGLGAGRPVTLQQWLERVHPRDRERVLAHATQTRVTAPVPQGRARPLSRLEYRVRHVNGSIRWLETTVAKVPVARPSDSIATSGNRFRPVPRCSTGSASSWR